MLETVKYSDGFRGQMVVFCCFGKKAVGICYNLSIRTPRSPIPRDIIGGGVGMDAKYEALAKVYYPSPLPYPTRREG